LSNSLPVVGGELLATV